jgi:hypothetical protein
MLKSIVKWTLLPAAAAVLVACGGGGGGAKQSITLNGTAAVGSAVDAAIVNVYDSTGLLVGSGTTGSDGTFSITLTTDGKAPYVLKVVKDEITLHALHSEAASGAVNITPLSDGVAAMVSPTGSAAGLIAALQQGATAPTAELINERREVITAALGGMVSAAGASGNIFTTPFSTNGKGQDKLLDSVSVNSVADGKNGKANIQITYKIATDPINPAAQMPTVNLTPYTTRIQAQAQSAQYGLINANDLPPDNAGDLYKELLDNLNACYREAPSVRTDGISVVKSAACKKLFLDNDPSKYLNFGQILGKTAQFAGMFTYPGAVEFKPVTRPYLVQDLNGTARGDNIGRAIVALSWINEQGNRENIMLYTTKYTFGGKETLGLSGDQNRYPWVVVSHNQKREFPLRSDSSLDYVQSQYLISIRELNQNGKSVINYATVEAPGGKKILMASAPGGASRDLAICKVNEVILGSGNQPSVPKNTETTTYGLLKPKFTCTGTSKSLTYAQKFVSTSETRLPSDIRDVGILRPLDDSGQPYTPDSATLADFPSMGVWSVEYTFMDGSKVNQKTWSVARPMTVEELMGPDGPDAVMPRYTTAAMNSLKALKNQNSNILTACYSGDPTCDPLQSPVPAPSTGGFKLAWTDSLVPMTSLWHSGRLNENNVMRTWISGTNATGWDDQIGVASTTRNVELKCSRQSDSDMHCADAVGDFNLRSWMTYSELWGKDAEQRNQMRSYNWYQPRQANGSPF